MGPVYLSRDIQLDLPVNTEGKDTFVFRIEVKR